MRLIFTLFSFFLLNFAADAQKMSGIWRGYFSSANGLYRDRDGNPREETYKFEIQIDQQGNNSIKGVTYSYKTTIFYGKAEMSGIYTPSTKSLIFKEIKMVELKITDKSEPCLMTCYLDYSKIGKLETLEGTFISVNAKDKGDCGSGKIYLERVPVSDFKKEDFSKKTDTVKPPVISQPTPLSTPDKNKPMFAPPATTQGTKKDNLVTKPIPKPNTQQQKPVTSGTVKVTPPPVKKMVPKPVPRKNTPPAKTDNPPAANRTPEKIQEATATPKEEMPTIQQNQERKIPIPKVLTERENKLEKVINVSGEIVEVNFYDNGVIDNDSITVYHNNELMVSHGRLSLTPISFKIKCSKTDSRHELIIVAENLGSIPPNTAFIVIKSSSGNNIMKEERFEVNVSSDEKRNAKVVINYVPKD